MNQVGMEGIHAHLVPTFSLQLELVRLLPLSVPVHFLVVSQSPGLFSNGTFRNQLLPFEKTLFCRYGMRRNCPLSRDLPGSF